MQIKSKIHAQLQLHFHIFCKDPSALTLRTSGKRKDRYYLIESMLLPSPENLLFYKKNWGGWAPKLD